MIFMSREWLGIEEECMFDYYASKKANPHNFIYLFELYVG